MVYTHNGLLFSHAKEEDILPFAETGMDFEHIMLNEISQIKILYGLTYTWRYKKSNRKKKSCYQGGGG